MPKRFEISVIADLPADAFASIKRQGILMTAAEKFRDEIAGEGVTFSAKVVTVKATKPEPVTSAADPIKDAAEHPSHAPAVDPKKAAKA